MPRRRGLSTTKKAPQPKKLKIELLPPDDKPAHEPYKILQQMRREHHPDLKEAKIAIAWMIDVKADKDGHVPLGKCVLVSELHRELAEWDIVILLNREVWQSKEFSVEKKRALVDHELQHADISLDGEGKPKRDARERILYRSRRHDIEEFHCIARRHGIWKSDLERFAEALLASKAAPLFEAVPSDGNSADAVICQHSEAAIH